MMPVLNTDLEFEAFCTTCSRGMCGNCDEGHTKRRGMPFISITPCESCIEEAKASGYDDGFNSRDKEVEVLKDEIYELKKIIGEK